MAATRTYRILEFLEIPEKKQQQNTTKHNNKNESANLTIEKFKKILFWLTTEDQ